MPLKLRRKKRRQNDSLTDLITRSDRFIMRMTATYVHRHLSYCSSLNGKAYETLVGVLEESGLCILNRTLERWDGRDREDYQAIVSECNEDNPWFHEIVDCIFEKAPAAFKKEFRRATLAVIAERIEALNYRGQSQLEKNIAGIKKLLGLTEQEMEFALFLYIISVHDDLEEFFVDRLKCQKFTGRKYLGNALAMTKTQLDQVLHGTLKQIEFYEMDTTTLAIEDDFLFLFDDPQSSTITEKFYKKLPRNTTIPLDYHLTVQKEIGHVIELLEQKPETSTHILLYGLAGTGKTSFAQGLAKELVIPAYGIAKDDENISKNRRAGILACLNMTNGGDGSLIVIDEADNILNTRFSWFFRGETQDKGWLNQLLEVPGVRMIWITNRIGLIEPSVLRRFAFSLHFKPFNKRQRMLLWGNILRRNKAKRFFKEKEIMALARKFRVSAGAIDLAVKKAIEANPGSKEKFHRIVETALEAHQILLNSGEKEIDKDKVEENYSVDGLNISGNLAEVISQLEKFDKYLRTTDQAKAANMNLLFHGPPGTGKSELARYLGQRLDREIICKRVSDLQSCYVGEAEKNIRDAFQEAEREEAILIMDEADSLLFSRDRAVRSWEVSFTNEFLTRMERFRGILICTTNRLKDLDRASIRRFQQKLRFDYLNPEANMIFYEKLLASLIPGPIDRENKKGLEAITGLAPGDFKTVRDRFGFHPREGLTHKILVGALREEAEIKRHFNGDQPIGF